MRDWLTIIIVLLIVGILLDGLRRMRQSRRESLRLSRRAMLADGEPETAENRGEFPSGGARVAAYRDPKDAENLNKNVRKTFEKSRITVGAPQRIPEQVTLNLEESVPMLMDSVAMESTEADSAETNFADTDPTEMYSREVRDHEDDMARQGYEARYEEDESEPSLGSLDELELDDEDTREVPAPKTRSSDKLANKFKEVKESVKAKLKEHEARQADFDEEPEHGSSGGRPPAEPDEVLIINVMARKGERFSGGDLLQALMGQKMKFGAMDIFHRHTDDDGYGPVIFSLANMVVPGTFNLAAMRDFSTPGVSIFMSLPVEAESIAAFDTMAATAKALAEELGGELKDENRSVMTRQTIEHSRQRVVEYERKKKLAAHAH